MKLLKKMMMTVGLSVSLVYVAAETKVDEKLEKYQKVQGVSGNINSVGSDTLLNLMSYWSESFKKKYPNIKVQIEAKGSSTAPPALISGTSQFGPMSRKMKSKEIDAFEKKYGFKPMPIGVALDSLAVYVNKDNPLKEISLPKTDAVFSKFRKGGFDKDITKWGDLGLSGIYAEKPISLYGRNSASGTYGYFKKKALFKGDYKDSVKEQPGSASVIMSITEDIGGIGYSGIGYKTSGVKALSVAKKLDGKAYEPNYQNVLEGKYPLGRMLYIYVAKAPNKPLSLLQTEFIKFILSKEGQEIVLKDGYLPLPKTIADKELKKIK